MLSVACWKIPNCNSHHATSSLQYLLFKTKQNVSVFTNVLAIHSEARQPFVLTNRFEMQTQLSLLDDESVPISVCTPVFPRMQCVSLNISHVSNYTLPAGIFS